MLCIIEFWGHSQLIQIQKIQIQIQKFFIATNTLIYMSYTYWYAATMRVTKQTLICPSIRSEINYHLSYGI